MADAKDYVPIIQCFTGENFLVWKFQMTLILNSRGLMSIVDGSEKKPTGEATDPLVVAWTKKNTSASSLLVQTIDQEILKTLIACTIAAEMWSTLTPKVLRGQILAFAVLGHVAVIRRCDMIFGEFYGR
jgi:hypothetical protein